MRGRAGAYLSLIHIFYAELRRVLNGESMLDAIYKMLTDTVENVVDSLIGDDQDKADWDLRGLNETLLRTIPLEPITPVSYTHLDVYKRQRLYPAPAIR